MTITLNGSGSITGLTSGAGIAATALSGQVPDANAPSGSVIQVVTATYSTLVSSTTSSFADTGLTASITPISSSSKILVLINQRVFCQPGSSASASSGIKVFRDATQIYYINRYALNDTSTVGGGDYFTTMYLDSPSTTSSTTYKTQFNRQNGSAAVYVQLDSDTSTIVLMEIAA